MTIDRSRTLPAGEDLSDRHALGRLRDGAFRSVGVLDGIGVLYGLGYSEGRIEGMRVRLAFEAAAGAAPRFAGPGVPILFVPEQTSLESSFTGVLIDSPEATHHSQTYPPTEQPVCFLSAGYAAGWYSEILHRPVLVSETECRADGADACRFEVRPASDWERPGDGRARALFDTLDFAALTESAHLLVEEREPEGSMLGAFDPMSPVPHVWGPVMILPYSGGPDSDEVLEAIEEDLGPDRVRVVVIDVTGARIDSLEAVGLARLLDRVECLGAEPVLVGLDRNAHGPFRADAGLSLPLIAGDLEEAIALGFQICRSLPGS